MKKHIAINVDDDTVMFLYRDLQGNKIKKIRWKNFANLTRLGTL